MNKKKIWRLISKIRLCLTNSILLFKVSSLIKKTYYRLATKGKDLCLEGFPRSANSFTYSILKVANPKLKIAHHTHNLANVKMAFKNKVPVLVPIRNPLDAINSLIIRSMNRRNINLEKEIVSRLEKYIYYHKFILENKDSVQVIDFPVVTKDITPFLKVVKRLGFISQKITKKRVKTVLRLATERMKTHDSRKEDFKTSASPSQKRNKLKKSLRKKIEKVCKENEKFYKTELDEANTLYRELAKKAVA